MSAENPSVLSDAHRKELERLLDGIQDAVKRCQVATQAAVDAQSEADAAAVEVARWENAYKDEVEKLRREATRV